MLATWGTSTGRNPTLDLQFAGATSLDNRITFSRASTATYFNSLGVLTTANNNVARFDYNPSTLAARGLLIEEQRTNLVLQSEDFSTTWSAVRSSVSTNQTTSPAGTVTADKIIEDSSVSTTHFVRQDIAVVSGVAYTWSVFAKADTRSEIQLAFGADNGCFPTADAAIFTLTGAGSVTVVAGTPNATIQALANGWYRCSVRATCAATATGIFRQFLASGGTASYTGNGTSGLFMWGAQLEAGAFPTSYIPTTTTALTRNADVASMTGTNFSSWYNASEGTLFAEASRQISGVVSGVLAGFAQTATFNQSIYISNDAASGNVLALNVISGVAQASIGGLVSPAVTSNFKTALAYATNNFAGSINGGTPVTDTSGTVPTPIGAFAIGSAPWGIGSTLWSGYIRRITYYPTRLPNSTLQALTA